MTVTSAPQLSALALFDAALIRAAAGDHAILKIQADRQTEHYIDAATWCRTILPGDHGLISRCAGPTLDVGCGPGRLTSNLNRLGRPALGVDISATAIRLARARGATALRRDVFTALPGEGRWMHLLLADGNAGIGGNPAMLLHRCHDLLAPDGHLHIELAPPGSMTWSGNARLSLGDAVSRPFPWAVLAASDLTALVAATAFRLVETWTEAGRWFANLTRPS